MNVVAAEDIGKLPANTALEALSRLPGIEVYRFRGEAQELHLRGLGNVVTTINGRETFIGASRTTTLDVYPPDQIKSIEAYNALVPELVEGGIAGALNVSLRRPLDLKKGYTVAGNFKGSIEDQGYNKSYAGSLLGSGRWDTSIGEIGLLLSGSHQHRKYLESYHDNYQRTKVLPGQIVSPPTTQTDLVYPFGVSTLYALGDFKRSFASGTLQWNPSSNLSLLGEVTYINSRNNNIDKSMTSTISFDFAPTPLSDVSILPGTNIISAATFTPADAGGPFTQGYVATTKSLQYEGQAIYTGSNFTLSTDLVYSDSTYDFDQRQIVFGFNTAPRMRAEFQSGADFGGNSYSYLNTNLLDPSIYRLRSLYSNRIEAKASGLQWRNDLTLELGDGLPRQLKIGTRYTTRTAKNRSGDRFAFLQFLGIPVTSIPGGDKLEVTKPGFRHLNVDVPKTWIGYSDNALYDSANNLALNQFVADKSGNAAFSTAFPADNPALAFSATEKTYAFYGQVHYGFDLGSIPVNGVVGARVVNTALSIQGTEIRNVVNGGVTTVTNTPINARQNYLDINPSISAVLHFTDTLQLRLSGTRTLSRPDFSQLNPTITLSNNTTQGADPTASAGNPRLNPVRSNNYDASLEYYFGKGSSASIAVFYRDINGFIVQSRSRTTVPNFQGPVTLTQPINAGKGTIKGAEVALNTFFTFLPGWAQNFGAGVNFTYLDTKQTLPGTPVAAEYTGPIPGASKYVYNISAYYNDEKLVAAVSYNWRSRFLLVADPLGVNDLNWYPIQNLVASLTYNVSPNIAITVDGSNLLGRPQRNSFGSSNFVGRVYFQAREFSAAVRFKL